MRRMAANQSANAVSRTQCALGASRRSNGLGHLSHEAATRFAYVTDSCRMGDVMRGTGTVTHMSIVFELSRSFTLPPEAVVRLITPSQSCPRRVPTRPSLEIYSELDERQRSRDDRRA
jgi:hypothetical protein